MCKCSRRGVSSTSTVFTVLVLLSRKMFDHRSRFLTQILQAAEHRHRIISGTKYRLKFTRTYSFLRAILMPQRSQVMHSSSCFSDSGEHGLQPQPIAVLSRHFVVSPLYKLFASSLHPAFRSSLVILSSFPYLCHRLQPWSGQPKISTHMYMKGCLRQFQIYLARR